MLQRQLIRRLARQAQVSEAVAADSLDKMIHDVLRRLRRKERAEVPGVAALQPRRDGYVEAIPLKGRKQNPDESR